MTQSRTDSDERIRRDATRTVAKLSPAALSLALLSYLVTLLPGTDRLIPGTNVSVVAVAGAVAGLAITAILLYAAQRLAAITRDVLDGPPRLVEHVASIVHWLVVLAAVLVAHAALAPVVLPVLGDLAWIYDVAFLLASVPILVVVAVRLYVALDPAADLVADSVAREGA